MARHSDTPNVPSAEAKGITDRYEIHELLGRGGMACVYRAVDVTSGRQVALKQLTVDIAAPERANVAALFEREFHTLTQLRTLYFALTGRVPYPARTFADVMAAWSGKVALSRLMLKASRTRPLLIAVDDVHRIDASSAALLATLIDKAGRNNMLVALDASVARAHTDKQGQLLQALALHLLRTGDTTGIGLAS